MKNKNNGAVARSLQEKKEAKDRIDNYNANPNHCLNCDSPIYAPYDKKLRETIIKKFCSRQCVAIYNNANKRNCKIDDLSDEKILEAFELSSNKKDFLNRIGYSCYQISDKVKERLKNIGIDIDDYKIFNQDKKQDSIILNMTKGDLFSRYSLWQTARVAIQKLARNIYKSSDKPQRCIVCGYEKHFEVAHVKSVSSFDNSALISEIDDIGNLIALCPNHHWEYDNGFLNIDTYI